MAKKLFGAALKAHNKKLGRKSTKTTKSKSKTRVSTGKGVMHKAYSYKGKGGKVIHVKAHVEHPKHK